MSNLDLMCKIPAAMKPFRFLGLRMHVAIPLVIYCSFFFCRHCHCLQMFAIYFNTDHSRYVPNSQPWLRPSSTCLSDGWFGWIHQKHLSCNRSYHSSWLQGMLNSDSTMSKSMCVWIDSGGLGPFKSPFSRPGCGTSGALGLVDGSP